MKKRNFDVGECSHTIDYRSSDRVGDDLVLESKHKIFLSHSGVQKEFVEHLCKALEDHCHYPFFDKRPQSLLKGKEFPSLIVKAAQQCQLLVVVVTEEYFMSKWPMIELNAFVQASKVLKSNKNVAILPLFYGLSVSDLKDERRRQRWLEKWETFVEDDSIEGRIKVEDWYYALDELTKFNGLSYDQELKEIVAYENAIVSHICTLVLPDIKWHDSHVQGNVHEVLLDKMKQIGLSQMYKVKVVGLYGVGGIGKTTSCKTLCNELSSKYEGRVCHVEFDSTCSNSKELLQNAVINLTRRGIDFVRQLDEGVCKDVLYKNLHKHQTFLAIDNVWDNNNSIKQARMFLETSFHEDSLVLVTARSQSILALLGIDGDACLEMPELEEADATNLFLYYAAPGKQFTSRVDMDCIAWCVDKCYFSKGDRAGCHYHPLALEALGRQLHGFQEKPSKWVRRLSRVWKSNSFLGENAVFDVLRSSFDLLQPIEQTLFIDVGLFLPSLEADDFRLWRIFVSWKEELCVLYKKHEFEIQSQLDSLKRKGLLQDADLTSGRIAMHDLYHEFVTLEVLGKSNLAIEMGNRKWVLIDGDLSELEVIPAGRCWQKLSRLCIRTKEKSMFGHLLPKYCPPTNPITSLEGIKWKYFSNVLILQLYGLKFVHGRLNLEGMTSLRSLQLYELKCLESLEGLESLKHLTCFDCENSIPHDVMTKTHIVGQFPASLKYLYMNGRFVLFGSYALVGCNNLIKLKLLSMEVGVVLDLNNCSSLEVVEIFRLQNLQTLSGLTSRLHTLDISNIDGICIPRLDQVHGLIQLTVVECGNSWEVSCLLSLTKLQALTVGTHAKLAENFFPHQLQELHYIRWGGYRAPSLNVFKQLQVLDLYASFSLIQMYGMGDLPALQSLILSYCVTLERLPNLSKSKNLEELRLDCCEGLELHKEDFEMLATLPLLHPVVFSSRREWSKIRLDIVGRKVLRYLGPTSYSPIPWLAWKEGELEELELGPPPIKLGNRGNWDTCAFDESDMEELEDIRFLTLHSVDSDTEDIESDMENILETYDINQMTRGKLDLTISRPPSTAFCWFASLWIVVGHIKEFFIAKIST